MISAELPIIAKDPDNVLQNIISSIMVYNLYGLINSNVLCMKLFSSGNTIWCSKNYLKQFAEEIIIL